MPLSDNEIIRTIRQGAEEAFAELVDRYKDKAMTLAVRMLKSREDADGRQKRANMIDKIKIGQIRQQVTLAKVTPDFIDSIKQN